MSKITPCTLSVEDIACWIAEIKREYPILPRGELRIGCKQLHELRTEFVTRYEFDRIETEQRCFTEVKAYPVTIEANGFVVPF